MLEITFQKLYLFNSQYRYYSIVEREKLKVGHQNKNWSPKSCLDKNFRRQHLMKVGLKTLEITRNQEKMRVIKLPKKQTHLLAKVIRMIYTGTTLRMTITNVLNPLKRASKWRTICQTLFRRKNKVLEYQAKSQIEHPQVCVRPQISM